MSLDLNGLRHLHAHIVSLLSGKVDKVDGKGLSTNDYTTDDKTKLTNIPTPTAVDAGKFLRVNAQGMYELVAIPNAEEATF